MTAPVERRCRRCGATSGIRLFTTVLGPREWECLDGCRPAPLPEMTAVPGEPLPPVPESAYPPGAVPLDVDLAAIQARAEAASDGPWEAASDGLVWAPRMGDPVSGSTEPEDAAWIAMAHPGLAEPLAEGLERSAAYLEENLQVWTFPTLTDGCQVNIPEAVERNYGEALAVARVLLGVLGE